MKHLQKKYVVIALLMATVTILVYCTKRNQIIDENPSSDLQLISLKAATGPALDGIIDPSWANCQKLTTTVTVPDPGNDYFEGYVGNQHTVSLRSMYDAGKIYFLAEWNDATKNLNRECWYFDPVAKVWEQESAFPIFDQAGNKIREAFYEDKYAMFWNINNSVANFNSVGCYAVCHTSLNPATHGGALGRHFTNSPTEFVDMWHWKAVRTGMSSNQIDDQYINNTEFDPADGGRHSDPKISGGYSDNAQTLPVTGGTPGQTMRVPKYFVPGSTYYWWILKSDQVSGTAKLITGVDVNGILSYSGGTIDPNTDIQFQRSGATTGSKCIPSVCDIAPIVGDRGDIDAKAIFTGNGWILEFSRNLNTASGNAGNKDVQFDITSDYVFGIAVFDNADMAMAINPKIVLKFSK